MENLIIKATDRTPEILIDYKNGVINMDGICVPENPIEFFEPLFNGLKIFTKKKQKVTFDIFLEYFNTSSSKKILDLFILAAQNNDTNYNSEVVWKVEKDDEQLFDAGELLREISNINLKIEELPVED